MKLIKILASIILIYSPCISNASELLIGVAEEYSNTPDDVSARIMFSKTNGVWKVLDSQLDHEVFTNQDVIEWYLAFDGKNLGKLITGNAYHSKYPKCP